MAQGGRAELQAAPGRAASGSPGWYQVGILGSGRSGRRVGRAGYLGTKTCACCTIIPALGSSSVPPGIAPDPGRPGKERGPNDIPAGATCVRTEAWTGFRVPG